MQIGCPTCAARYNVPDSRMRPGGAVRCSRCGSIWTPGAGSLSLATPPARGRRVAMFAGAALAVLLAAGGAFAVFGGGVRYAAPPGPAPTSARLDGPADLTPAPNSAKLDAPADQAPLLAPPTGPEPSLATAPPLPAEPSVPERQPALREAGPGLALVVGPGDTMPSLYAKVYRGLHAPDYSQVLAMNQGQFKPGAVVLFPTPPDGWVKR